MDLRKKLDQERNLYIQKYNSNPNIIFVSNNLYLELDKKVDHQSLYDAAPKHFRGADVLIVPTPNYIKFAEFSDVRKALQSFQNDNSLDSYKVSKSQTTIGGAGGGLHKPSQLIELEPIEFSREEIEIYQMQN